MARPMAPTHNTDSEQRVIQLTFNCSGDKCMLCHRRPMAGILTPRRREEMDMLFIINTKGVPSVAKFVRLQ